MLKMRGFIFLLCTLLLSLNVAIAGELLTKIDHHAPVQATSVSHSQPEVSTQMDCKSHCAATSAAGNHCSACLTGLPIAPSVMVVSPVQAIQIASLALALQSIDLPPPLHPPLQRI